MSVDVYRTTNLVLTLLISIFSFRPFLCGIAAILCLWHLSMEPHDSPRCSSQKSGSPGGLHLPYPHTQTFSQDDPGEWGALFLMSAPCVSSMRKCFEVQVASTTSFGPWCVPFGICIHLDEGQCGVPVLESIALCSLHALPFTNASQSATLISILPAKAHPLLPVS